MSNEYDEFEATMLEAGWSLDEIEAIWQKHSVKSSPNDYPGYTPATASAIWTKETLGEDY